MFSKTSRFFFKIARSVVPKLLPANLYQTSVEITSCFNWRSWDLKIKVYSLLVSLCIHWINDLNDEGKLLIACVWLVQCTVDCEPRQQELMLQGNIAVFRVLFLWVLVFWVLGLRSFRFLGLQSLFSRHPDDRCQTQVVSFSYYTYQGMNGGKLCKTKLFNSLATNTSKKQTLCHNGHLDLVFAFLFFLLVDSQ